MPELASALRPAVSEKLLRGEPVDYNTGIYVEVLSAGTWHSVAVASDGHLYAWGRNSAGQLGLPHEQLGAVVDKPTLLESLGDTRVVAVSAAASHTLAMGYPGNAWTS